MPGKMRRMKGEGSVTQRKNGLYVVRFNGLVKTTMDRTLVPELLNDLRARNDSQLDCMSDPTIERALDEWLATKSTSLKSTSLDRIEQTLNNQIKPYIGKMKCSEFSDTIFTKHIMSRMILSNLSYSSVKKAYDNMNNFCNWCTLPSKKYMKYNPMIAVKKPSKTAGAWSGREDSSSNVSVFLNEEQRLSFIKACRHRYTASGEYRFRYGEAYIFDMYTGLRMGELLALTWNDVDFINKAVRVHSTMELVKDRDHTSKTFGKKILVVFQYTKTNQPRIVPLGDMALSAITNMLTNRIQQSPYVVHDKKGSLVSPNNFSKGLIATFDLAGIELPCGTNVHALRHTFASMCFAAKLPIRTISELLGHSSVQITMDTYIHLIQENGVIHVPELVNLK